VCDVNIDALMVGSYPGDGLPKPIAVPEPEVVTEFMDDAIPYISLKTLLELKMASGLTAAHRIQDLGDVIQLIKVNHLPIDYPDQLNPHVQDKFRELWQSPQVFEEY